MVLMCGCARRRASGDAFPYDFPAPIGLACLRRDALGPTKFGVPGDSRQGGGS